MENQPNSLDIIVFDHGMRLRTSLRKIGDHYIKINSAGSALIACIGKWYDSDLETFDRVEMLSQGTDIELSSFY